VLVEGAISGPLSNSVSAGLAFNDTHSDGYQKSLTTGRTNGGLDRANVRAIFDCKPVDGLKVRSNRGSQHTGSRSVSGVFRCV
jgi:iron complex outermembrane recepter protein